MKTKKPLSNKTPHWFQDWHIEHFLPNDNRGKRNEKWIYIILTAIIGSGVLANGNKEVIVALIKSILGG
ncbi:hypothetical protein LCGC14_2149620 [marine sediment metagenome]|uniref:Uncharacterized protein n=1 Tax=marine sediment metagenome TaxID=412755 RepID=A0A0F9DVS0_9ZZZZ